jgi:hypothetical protein
MRLLTRLRNCAILEKAQSNYAASSEFFELSARLAPAPIVVFIREACELFSESVAENVRNIRVCACSSMVQDCPYGRTCLDCRQWTCGIRSFQSNSELPEGSPRGQERQLNCYGLMPICPTDESWLRVRDVIECET